MCVCTYAYTCMNTYHIYIYIERDVYMYIHIYIYVCIASDVQGPKYTTYWIVPDCDLQHLFIDRRHHAPNNPNSKK